MTAPSDLELLCIQAGATRDLDGLTIASARDGSALFVGDLVSRDRARALDTAFGEGAERGDLQRILEAGGRTLRCTEGLVFVFPVNVAFASKVRLERSGASGVGALRALNPGNWHPVEWDELLDGVLGPWTMAVEDDAVVSLCHTPGPMTERGAECGVWTRPDRRGRGHAAAVTAAWATLVRRHGRQLFYGCHVANVSSQRVAERLGLRHIGWTWRLDLGEDTEGTRLHPLCSAARGGEARRDGGPGPDIG